VSGDGVSELVRGTGYGAQRPLAATKREQEATEATESDFLSRSSRSAFCAFWGLFRGNLKPFAASEDGRRVKERGVGEDRRAARGEISAEATTII